MNNLSAKMFKNAYCGLKVSYETNTDTFPWIVSEKATIVKKWHGDDPRLVVLSENGKLRYLRKFDDLQIWTGLNWISAKAYCRINSSWFKPKTRPIE